VFTTRIAAQMLLKRIVLCALLSCAAPSFAAPIDQIVPETAPDTDLLQVSSEKIPRNDPVSDEEHISRAQPCADDHACTFDMLFNVHGGTSMPDSEEFLPDRSLTNVKYTLQVTPDEAPYGAKVWNVKGASLLAVDGESLDKDASALFRSCEARLVQGSARGDVLAIIHNAHSACPEELSNLLVSSAKSLVPVKGHTAHQGMFSHRELVGTDDRRVDYTADSSGEDTHIRGRVFHRHFNDDVLMSSDELERFHDGLAAHTTTTRTHIVGKTVDEHHTTSKVRLAAVQVQHEATSPEVTMDSLSAPEGVTGGEAARRQEDLLQHVHFSANKVQTKESPTPATLDQGIQEFLQTAQRDGNEVNDLSHHPFKAEKKENPFLKLNSDQQHTFFDNLVSEIPELLRHNLVKLARHKCDQVTGTPEGQQILMENLNNRKHYELHTSAMLLGGVDRARPLPADDLLSIANNEDFVMHTRQQAMYSLIQPECAHEHHLHAIHGLSPIADKIKHNEITDEYEPGMHTTALHVQHALVQQAVRCSQGAALSAVTGLLQSTEQFARDSLAQKDWPAVKYALLALGNSRFERHRHVVRAVQAHPEVPENVAATADWVDGKLPTSPALADSLAQTSTSKSGMKDADKSKGAMLDWSWSVKLPEDGKDGAPNPKFQGQFYAGAQAGAKDDGSGKGTLTWGAAVYAYAKVKFWDDSHTYQVIKAEFGFWFPNDNYPGGKTKPELIVSMGPNEIKIYTYPTVSKDVTMKQDNMAGDTTIELNSEDKIGYCETDINSLNGFKGNFAFDKTLLEFNLGTIPVGPVPLSLAFRLKSKVGFQLGVGATGGSGAVSSVCGGVQSKVSSTANVCGGGITDGAILGFIQPEFTLTAEAEASVDAWIMKVGAGLSIDVLQIKVPATAEHFTGKAKTNEAGWGFGLQVRTSAGNGRFYFFFEWSTWFSAGRKQWDVLTWTGMSWNFPPGKELIGHFTKEVKMPACVSPPIPDPSDTDCQIVFYEKANLQGDDKWTYFTSSGKQGNGELKTLPDPIQDKCKSARTMGNCKSVELVDDDNGYKVGDSNNGMMFDVAASNFPSDLQNDIRQVNIIALPPLCPGGKCPSPKPQTAWQKYCHTVVYYYPNYIGFQKEFKLGAGQKCRYFVKDLYVSSLEISPGCNGIYVYDDDEEEGAELLEAGSMGAQNKHFTSSQASIDNDLVNDIKQYNLYGKGFGLSTSCSAGEEEMVETNVGSLQWSSTMPPAAKRSSTEPKKKLVKDTCKDPNCCYRCYPNGIQDLDFTKQHCWKGTQKQATFDCGAHPVERDYDCACTKQIARIKTREAVYVAKQDKDVCEACGTITDGTKEGKGKKTDLPNKSQCQQRCKAAKPAQCSSDCSNGPLPIKNPSILTPRTQMEEWFLEEPKGKGGNKDSKTKAPTVPEDRATNAFPPSWDPSPSKATPAKAAPAKSKTGNGKSKGKSTKTTTL